MHRSQVLFWLLLAFLVGVFFGSLRTLSENILWGATAIGTIVVGVSAYHRTFGHDERGIARRKLGVLVGCCILFASYGIYRFQQFDADHSRITPFNNIVVGGKPLPFIVRGYVAGDIVHTAQGVQFPLIAKEIQAPGRKIFTNERMLVELQSANAYRYGDMLALRGPLKAPTSTDTFDYVTYLKKQGIRSIMRNPEIASISLSVSRTDELSIRLHRSLQTVKHAFESAVTKSMAEPEAAYVNGTLTGSRTDIPAELKDAFARTSTSHILAISGFNIAIVAEAVMALFLFVVPRRKAFWCSVVAIGLFTILTGASASVVRAAIMGLVLLFSLGYGRLYSARHAIALAAAVMVFANPFILAFDVGFQLSFLAVLGIVYLYPVLDRALRRIPSSSMKELALMTASAQIMVFPALIWYFNSFSVVALIVNVLVLPFVPLLMGLGFITGILGMVAGVLGKIVGVFAWALAKYQIGVVTWFSHLSWAAVTVHLSLLWIAVLYAIIIGVTAYVNYRYER